ncbi:hypothetical protein Aperf_G00000064443 [Anoplocephala perfoliata]
MDMKTKSFPNSCADIRECLMKLAEMISPEFAACLERSTPPITDPKIDEIACNDLRKCLVKLAEISSPELAACLEACNEEIPCSDNQEEPVVEPLLNQQPTRHDLRKCLIKLAEISSPELAACLEACNEEIPCSDNQEEPVVEPPVEPTTYEAVNEPPCSDLRKCLIKLAEISSPELAACLEACNEEIPCSDNQEEPVVEPPVEPTTYEAVNEPPCSDLRKCLIKLAEISSPELAACLEACNEEIPCSDNQEEPVVEPPVEPTTYEAVNEPPCSDLRKCLIKLAEISSPELAACLEACNEEIPCSDNQEEPVVEPPVEPTTYEAVNEPPCSDLRKCLIKLAEISSPELAACLEACNEEIPCSDNQEEPVVEPPVEPTTYEAVNEPPCSDLRKCLIKLAEISSPELAACLEACNEEIPCSDNQEEPVVEPPVEPTTYEAVNEPPCSDLRKCLIKLAEISSPELAACLEACNEEIPCSDAQAEPVTYEAVTEPPCNDLRRCLIKLAEILSLDLAACLEACDEEQPCSNTQAEIADLTNDLVTGPISDPTEAAVSHPAVDSTKPSAFASSGGHPAGKSSHQLIDRSVNYPHYPQVLPKPPTKQKVLPTTQPKSPTKSIAKPRDSSVKPTIPSIGKPQARPSAESRVTMPNKAIQAPVAPMSSVKPIVKKSKPSVKPPTEPAITASEPAGPAKSPAVPQPPTKSALPPAKPIKPVASKPPRKPTVKPAMLTTPVTEKQQVLPSTVSKPPIKPIVSPSRSSMKPPTKPVVAAKPVKAVQPSVPPRPQGKSKVEPTKPFGKPPITTPKVQPGVPKIRPCLTQLISSIDPELAGCLPGCVE